MPNFSSFSFFLSFHLLLICFCSFFEQLAKLTCIHEDESGDGSANDDVSDSDENLVESRDDSSESDLEPEEPTDIDLSARLIDKNGTKWRIENCIHARGRQQAHIIFIATTGPSVTAKRTIALNEEAKSSFSLLIDVTILRKIQVSSDNSSLVNFITFYPNV